MADHDLRKQLAQNLELVEQRIAGACRRAGRRRDEVTLIAVTKTVSSAAAMLLHDLGIGDLAESRPQELWRKAGELPKSIRWHVIGHLQRNKIDRTLPLVTLIHSIDSNRLLESLDKEANRQQRTIDVLLEVNLSSEADKTGLPPEQLDELFHQADQLQRVSVKGLMTMAALQEPETCRPTFARLRSLARTGHQLSMGMSNDFEVAIEEGATMIRLGSVLFEGIAAEHLQS